MLHVACTVLLCIIIKYRHFTFVLNIHDKIYDNDSIYLTTVTDTIFLTSVTTDYSRIFSTFLKTKMKVVKHPCL